MRNMRFVNKKTKTALANPPCLNEWRYILEVLKKVWIEVKAIGFPYWKLGLINPNVLENFFVSFKRF